MHPILADRHRLRLYLGGWALVGAMLGVLVRAGLNVPWLEAVAFGVPLGLIGAPLSLSAWYLCRALPLSRTPALRVATAASTAALTMAGLWAAVAAMWWSLLGRMSLATAEVQRSALLALVVTAGALAYLVSMSVQYILAAMEESTEARRRVLESEIAQREAELTALRAQVDPHFLFNSLNAISGLIVPDPSRARQMCQALADFLRDCLTLGSVARIPLGREVALADQYLRVEQVRFGRRLAIETTVSPDTADVPVPPLLLQPLVENAVRHGIATCLDGGTIAIHASTVGARAVVTVSNPRDTDGHRSGTGFGLGLVRRRLAGAYGDAAALVLEPAETTYRATVTIPADGSHP